RRRARGDEDRRAARQQVAQGEQRGQDRHAPAGDAAADARLPQATPPPRLGLVLWGQPIGHGAIGSPLDPDRRPGYPLRPMDRVTGPLPDSPFPPGADAVPADADAPRDAPDAAARPLSPASANRLIALAIFVPAFALLLVAAWLTPDASGSG